MTDQTINEMTGVAALPRQNGELVFDEPWESRAFGLAVALTELGAYPWEDFRTGLIDEIEQWEHGHRPAGSPSAPAERDGEWSYYQHWLASLERVLLERGLVSVEEIEERERTLATLDDHDHDHAHETREVTT